MLLVLACLPSLAAADQLADLAYSEQAGPDQTLDVYRPDTPGMHPMVVYVPGQDWQQINKRHIGNRALTLTSAGHLVVALNYRAQPQADWREQTADLAMALTFVRARAEIWGGDPNQILLLADGSGAHLVGSLLAKPAEFALESADLNAIRGLMLSEPQGMNQEPTVWQPGSNVPAAMRDAATWQQRSPVQQLASHDWPVLLSYPATDAPANRDLASRLQNLGMAVTEVQAETEAALADREREWMAAWLKALPIGRVQRFETMNLGTVLESGRQTPTFEGWQADGVGALFADRGMLYAGLDGAVSSRGPSRILVLRGSSQSWQEAFRFPDSVRNVQWIGRVTLASQSVLAAMVGSDADGSMLWVQQADRNWVSVPLPWDLAQSRVHSVLPLQQDTLLMADGRSGGIWRIEGDRLGTIKVVAQAEVNFNGRGAGLASLNGQVYAAWRYASVGSRVYVRQVSDGAVSWRYVGDTDTEVGSEAAAMAAITDDAGGGSLLIAHTVTGRITRVRPGSGERPVLEFELEAAMRRQFNDQGQPLTFMNTGVQTALHPETNERLTIIGFRRPVIAGNAADPTLYSHVLIRQSGGSYSLRSLAPDTGAAWQRGAIAAMAPSPFVEDQGRRWFFAGAGATESGNQAWLDQGALQQAQVKRGPWWNRAQSGHGFDIQKIGNQWAVLFYSFASDGQPQWWSALGSITNGQFVNNQNGLMFTEQVLRDGNLVSSINTERTGQLQIRFGLGAGDAACADGVNRADALALAEAEITMPGQATRRWCIEPMQIRGAGNGAVDNNGIWTAGLLDSGWGVSLFAQGLGAETTQGAIVYYFDGAGQPRWALGSGVQADGRATLSMLNVLNGCPTCASVQPQYRAIGQMDLQSSGACGEVSLRTSMDLRYPGLEGSLFVRNNLSLQRLSDAACY
ncbi:hypothetical protein C7S18_03410 [Ahniella affigens]|uniref:BD-FAE-like domain-containing protein n=1 Tax=Ahniella affigens TaxID=2021234 RepID=A0A2P1PN61_9GAMM|nr:alpha/beta hydrolase [Ahniella affigens]AVP96293.1 hypothetical protein C7S18_03410 [Ahniella affigens]